MIPYKEQYRALIAKHKWFPKKLSEELVYLVYGETVQVKIDIRDLHKRDDKKTPLVEVSLNLDDKMNSEEKLYVRVLKIIILFLIINTASIMVF